MPLRPSKLKLFFAALISSQLLVSAAMAASDDIIISAVGDVMMGTNYPDESMLPPDNGFGLFDPAKQWIQAADVRFANLEGTLFDGEPQPDGKKPGPNRYLFKTPTAMGQRLIDAGFNVISLANNHVKDFGQAGIQSTKATLATLGLQYSSKAGEVALLSAKGNKIALIATDFYAGKRSITNPIAVYEEIRKLKKEGYIVLVSSHVGGEGSTHVSLNGTEMYLGENRGDSVKFARTAIDSGADSIIMHGPHVPRALELYNKKLIIYSLGNFLTGRGISTNGTSGQAPLIRYQINRNGEFIGGQIVSFIQKKGPHRIEVDKQAGALKTIYNMTQEQFNGGGLSFEKNGIIRSADSNALP
ncbi:CapA family protein [Pseudobdellovibrio sp. HCB154]|uniref:CapA family protein n=1 Tax=Pseudobdellovibrio sp. HCB154 TaxID=3386277 RepID=UPI003916FB0F